MIKMKKIVVAACACAFALVALCGCQTESPELQGTWVLDSVEAEHEGIAMTAEEVDVLERGLGMTVTLKLKESGDATLDLFGDLMRGSWVQESDTSGTLTITDYGESAELSFADGVEQDESEKIEGVTFTVEGQNLKIVLADVTYVFVPAASEDAAAEGANAEGADAAAEETASEEAAA